MSVKTWYPALDERNGDYQLLKAEMKARDKYSHEMLRIQELRKLQERYYGRNPFSQASTATRSHYSVAERPIFQPAGARPMGRDSGAGSTPQSWLYSDKNQRSGAQTPQGPGGIHLHASTYPNQENFNPTEGRSGGQNQGQNTHQLGQKSQNQAMDNQQGQKKQNQGMNNQQGKKNQNQSMHNQQGQQSQNQGMNNQQGQKNQNQCMNNEQRGQNNQKQSMQNQQGQHHQNQGMSNQQGQNNQNQSMNNQKQGQNNSYQGMHNQQGQKNQNKNEGMNNQHGQKDRNQSMHNQQGQQNQNQGTNNQQGQKNQNQSVNNQHQNQGNQHDSHRNQSRMSFRGTPGQLQRPNSGINNERCNSTFDTSSRWDQSYSKLDDQMLFDITYSKKLAKLTDSQCTCHRRASGMISQETYPGISNNSTKVFEIGLGSRSSGYQTPRSYRSSTPFSESSHYHTV